MADKNVSVSDNYSKKEETVLKDQSPLVEEDEIATEENNSFDSREEPASADIFSAARPLLSSSVESSAAESTPLTPLAATTKKTSQSNVALWSPLATKIPPATSTSSTTTNNNATLDNNEVAEAAPLTLLISRVYSEGNDDWLEIWNYGEEDIDLVARKVRLEKSKTAVDPGIILRFDNIADRSFVSGSIIRAGEGYRVVRDDAAEELRVAASALALRPDFTLMDNAYTIYLASAAVSSPDDEDIIDTIGYGEAKYFEGAAPAPALEAGYLLRRKADANTQLVDILSGGSKENWPPVYDNDNNKNDWLLWPLGGVVPTADNEADDNNDNNQDNTDNNQNNNDNNDNSDDSGDSTSTPFTLSPGVNSAGLLKLWSFEECRGSTTAEMISHNNNLSLSQGTKWTIGRWGCGWRLPYQADGLITANLQPLLSGENFTLAFQFKDSGEYGHVYFNFYNQSENIAMKFDIFSNMMQFQGFPGLDGRYDCPGFMDNKWHQGSLVWNAIGGYWGVYIDGVEIFHQAFSGLAPGFDRVDFGAVAGIINIDDLALWNRALSLEELQSLASTAKPFNPQVLRENPASLLLKHAWNFDEASGTIAHDSVGALNWQLPEGALVYNGLSGKGLAFPPIGSSYPLSLPALKTNNFSASWWWQNNAALPYSGRLHIDFNQGTERLAGFIVDNSRQRLWANGEDEYLADGHEVLPEDNLWHHLALVYDDYRYLWQFFVDGVLKLESQRLPLLRGASIDNISLSSSVWDYKLDNFKLWQGSLDAAKVLSEYQAEKPE